MKQLYIQMPQPGETITEGTIVKWLAKAGDVVVEGTPLVELETEKALFEYESPFEGTIVKILHDDQSRLPVATPIAIMDVSDAKAKQYLMLGIAEEVNGGAMTAEVAKSSPAASTVKSSVSQPAAQTAVPQKYVDVILSPYVRRVAMEHGVSNEVLQSLGAAHPEGRITKETIEDFVKSGAVPKNTNQTQGAAKSASSADQGYDVMPFSPIRLRIAENMTKSKQTIPHAHTGLTVDMTNVVKYREANKESFQKKNGVSLSLLTLMLPTLIKAIRAFPGVNASYVGEGSSAEIRLFKSINLSLAVGTEAGLMTPVIKNVQALSVVDFAQKMKDVVDRASRKKLMPDDFSGTTFLFNNFGYFGLNSGVQVIQYPLAATLGMGCLEKKVVPLGEGIAVRDTANFFLAFDHRVIDGLEAGQFLTMIKESLENFAFTF